MKPDNSVPSWLLERTFEVQYCPNCPSPFLVRLVNPNTGSLDRKPYRATGYGKSDLTRDILGFGRTLAEAAEKARDALPFSIAEAEKAGELVDAMME